VTSAVAESSGWRGWFRRHERTLAACWLVAVGLGVVALLVAPVRIRLLNTLQTVVDRWDDRWSRRLAYGQALFRKGDFTAAAAYLERLDAEFPATTVRHSRDKQRELLLTMLGHSYEELDKKGKAMATFARLVAFDSLNYQNHYEQAQAAERLLSGWALAPEARDAYEQVLILAPYHVGAVRGIVNFYSDKGEWHPIVDAYQKYLDAFLVQRVELRLGDSSFFAVVPVDGLAHDVPAPLSAPRGWAGQLSIRPMGFAMALDSAFVTPAISVGLAERRAEVPLRLQPQTLEGMAAGPRGSVLPKDDASTLSVAVPVQAAGIEQVRLRIRLFKPVDSKMWGTVGTAFHNLLDTLGRAAADARTVPFATPEAADSVLLRQPLAHETQELTVDDRGN
jgi:tetratricopeptide (TPR) repeat protein